MTNLLSNSDKNLFVSHGDFTMGDNGLFRKTRKADSNGGEKTYNEFISAPFEVLGQSRNVKSLCWGKYIRWNDADGKAHTQHVSEASLQADPAALCQTLADAGLVISRSQQKNFINYLAGTETPSRALLCQRTGWHQANGHDMFVLPNETIGPQGSEQVILDSSALGPYEKRGTLSDWQEKVGVLSADHALPVMAISASLTGPLLYLSEQEGGGLNFYGQSSRGKTTILQVAASVWGRGGSPGFVRGWSATANGLEGAASIASDTCLVLDELGVIDPRDAASAIYSLSNGGGKSRAARDGSLREPKSWRVIIISSGEIPIEAKLSEERGKRARAGQLTRIIDVQADRGLGFGAFDNTGGFEDAGKLSQAFKLASTTSYGTAGPEFVRRLIENEITSDYVRRAIREFSKSVVPEGSDGQVQRVAERFGLIAVAGEIATTLQVTPWATGAAYRACEWGFHRWLEDRGGSEPAEIRQAIDAVRLTLEQHGDSRFQPLEGEDATRAINNRLGWRKGTGADREYWIPGQVWKSEICCGHDPRFVARVLAERGMLARGRDGFQAVRRVGGINHRVYVILPTIFDGVDDVI